MADRKVLVKYYSPDFDPSLIKRPKKAKNAQQQVNMMMPMSVTCKTCGTYIYRGTKLNSKKETVQGEDYCGIHIYRFYMRCPHCSAEFTIKTDPKNSNYAVEINCSRQMEPWMEEKNERDALIAERVQEEAGDAMKELENKQLDSKMEMEILDALDEIKALNARQAALDVDDLLAQRKEEDEQLPEEDEIAIVKVFEGGVKRLVDDEEEPELDFESLGRKRDRKRPAVTLPAKKEEEPVAPLPVVVVKSEPPPPPPPTEQKKKRSLVNY